VELPARRVLRFAANAGAYFGTPPNDVRFMAAGNLSMIILLWVCWRIDRQREAI
jgi:hypothetical protein